MQKNAISVTILTGFLGSGKTTFLNNLIKAYPNKKFTIIENEFGSVNIDRELIKNIEGTQIFELSNGCACCTMNAELGTTLNRLIISGIEYDHLIIEASGIADPASIVSTFLSGNRVRRYFKLDGVIAIVDAKNILTQLVEFEETVKQIAIAQVIIINKKTLISINELEKVENRIKQLNSEAIYQFVDYAECIMDNILNLNAFNSSQIEATLFSEISFNTAVLQKHSEHNHSISSYSYIKEGCFKMESFSFWLDSFLYYNKYNILRIKGILAFDGMQKKIVLQAVQDSIVLEQGDNWEGVERFIKLVIIGKNLDNKELDEKLNKLLC